MKFSCKRITTIFIIEEYSYVLVDWKQVKVRCSRLRNFLKNIGSHVAIGELDGLSGISAALKDAIEKVSSIRVYLQITRKKQSSYVKEERSLKAVGVHHATYQASVFLEFIIQNFYQIADMK